MIQTLQIASPSRPRVHVAAEDTRGFSEYFAWRETGVPAEGVGTDQRQEGPENLGLSYALDPVSFPRHR